MKTRLLGSTDMRFTKVGLGTWAIGGPWDWGWGPQDDEASIDTINQAVEKGVNWIDTAPCYGLGHSERVVGRAIEGIRENVFIATKCGLSWDDSASKTVISRLKKDSVRREVEASLKRLNIDQIDLYQMHWPNPDEDIEEAWEEMARIKGEGLVRYIGVSNFSVTQMKRASKIHEIASLQPPYSMLRRDFETAELAWCRDNNVGVIPYSPMQAGLLTGAFSTERLASLPSGDWRHKSEYFQQPAFSRHLETVELLKPLASTLGASLAELAIAWTLRDPAVTSAIVGARRPDQLEGTIGGADIELEKSTIDEIDTVLSRA